MTYFAQNLRLLREQKGLYQVDMYDAVGIKSTTWNNYERGVSTPVLADLIKISKYFGVSESDLIHTDLSKTKAGENAGHAKPRSKPHTAVNEASSNYNLSPAGKEIERRFSAIEKEIEALRKLNEEILAALQKGKKR